MNFAMSTACFFPEEPEKSFLRVKKLGFSSAEVFLNTDYEVSKEYIKELKALSESENVKIVSVHTPFGYAEPYLFFSPYIRRREEALDKYERMFEAVSALSPVIFNFHGGFLSGKDSLELGIEYYAKLKERADRYGVVFCQENVNRYAFSTPENIRALKNAVPDCNFTFDIKQANRAGFSPFDVADAMGERIKHFHINDYNSEVDCLLPGKGDFPIASICKRLKNHGFDGTAVVEVYRKSFGKDTEIAQSLKFLEELKW
ncbi:MAG: sugar phosphate isomerase/epimerase [Clostridia bacterium]|nr:sugar phosphate isomerase/epimerase [Clostridia bacterium]